ncbi:DUF5107 domain-containing protein [Amycolatopsis cihanbeyliensis]|uniref:Uncharacterized protein DUF5107 n=1 Tax=Amycolatopsis cihanbeyliensis TaxID=1128664 RepID=A0A542CUU3_AMYCI|nr:DUF5107 domain-containing protein [Amycolatopsis cihanbeyliensis]TQI94584.1 uncharacterized protein DUF5107 [Amycolatopsis cihanbeyliensis]
MRTSLSPTELVLPTAELGPENPLPPLTMPERAQEVTNPGELPPDLAANLAYGRLGSVLPYHLQDAYSRERTERELPAIVLDNGRLRATVLPSLGGRLYSLWHRESGRELVHRNPVCQPANLALRGAWFAGGVEWNLGSTGHTTLTCAPMHAARVTGPDGSPVLRLWEWERTRDLPYQVDLWLPPDSDFLYVGVRIRNPHPHTVPAYWWSNIAVKQEQGTRVLAPAEGAWRYAYSGRLERIPVPGTPDLTYPERHRHAADLFFDLPGEEYPLIAAVDERGEGLAQLSTGRLRGRKLFVWGTSAGGARWQEWLSPGAPGYLEIQAGLARTQLEHLPLPAGEVWDWLEAYGPLRTDPAVVHGPEWTRACAEVRERLPGASELAARYRDWLGVADTEPGEWLHTGSGWGALEARLRGLDLRATPFPASTLTRRQRPWLDLLAGRAPEGDPAEAPGTAPVSAPWRELVEAVADTWASWYQRGIARWRHGDLAGAEQAWRASLARAPNAWATRNLAVLAGERGRAAEAADLLVEAHGLSPETPALAVEALAGTLAAGRPEQARHLLGGLPARVRALGRVRLLEARLRLALGDPRGAEEIFDSGFEVPDIREGETLLSRTWEEIQHALAAEGRQVRPLPPRYDFRMTGW